MTELGILAAAFGFGVASALLPILNAEIYLGANVVLVNEPVLVYLLVFLMTLGTVVGKMLIFWGVRSGKNLVDAKVESRAEDLVSGEEPRLGPVRTHIRHWSRLMLRFLEDPVKGTATVFLSSVVGIPPLAVVSFLAGASKQSPWLFAAAVFAGRGIRFLIIAVPVMYFT